MAKSIFCLYGFAFLISGCASTASIAEASSPFISCAQDPLRKAARSKELQTLVEADQKDRAIPTESIDWAVVQPRDEARRMRVGEIFGEGCFTTSADYSAAAIVVQHGNIPDHYFQTFLWAKKAIELGDPSHIQEIRDNKKLWAEGIDRYLVNSKQKQLFGTQFSKPSLDPKDCWCIEEVEKSFSEKKRREYLNVNLNQILDGLNKLNAQNPQCKVPTFCAKGFKPSPVGTIPGFW